MKIELFQDLYERYSRLALSFPSDRPIAIKGLEARLLATFGTTGGFGIFDIYLHRCLLWQRSDTALKRIGLFRGGSLVPSWSWMAYDGHIRYMAVPFGKASWCEDIISPFTKARHPDTRPGGGGTTTPDLELEAPVWEIVNTEGGQVFLDDPVSTVEQPLYCVIVGKSKIEASNEQQRYWVLLVHATTAIDEGQVYERTGVGFLDGRHIALDGRHRTARIR
jgi:hypothetical protein